MVKNRGMKISNKEELSEDWCFQCKDGGELMLCDSGQCLKAYHPACVGKDDSVLTNNERWICGRHTCLICHGSSYYQCYCCDRAACSRCIGQIDFVHLKGENGLCNNCLKLALLVEEDRNIDSDGESVDLRDRETYEGLFRDYYEIVKEKEGIDKNKLLAGKAQLDKEKICQISSYSDKRCEKEDEQLSLDNEDLSDGEPQKKKLKMKRCTQQKTKTQRKVNCSLERNKISSIWYSTAAQSQFAALIPENIRLIYLKKSLVMELIKQPESIETKIIGSFVRVKLDPCDAQQLNSHQLVQIAGIKYGSSDMGNSESLIHVSNMAGDVFLTMLSDAEFSEEECHDLKERMKAGLLKKLTIVELEQRAKILHEDITKHRIARELALSQKLIDRANEKGWKREKFKHMQAKRNQLKPSYLSKELQNIPVVIPEKIELESLDSQMHRCSDETTPMKQTIPGVTPEKIELEPLSKDEKEVNQMHQCLDETTPTTRNIPGVIPKEVELEPLAEDEWHGNKMHPCADETTPTKKNILGVIPEEVEVDPMDEDERNGNKMHQCTDETTPTKKNVLGVTPEEVELECLAKDEKDVNQIHQCLDEKNPTEKNILGVIPEKVVLEPLAENEDEKLSSDNGDFSDGGPQKKRAEKKTCTQQKTKMQRRVTSQKKEFVGWGSKSLIDFLQFICQNTGDKLSPYDVTSMVYNYVKENNLIHPVEKRRILCDVQLEAILGKKVVNRDEIFSLLESHFVRNEERLQKDELDHDLKDDDTEMLVATKTGKKVEQNKRSSIWYSTAAQIQFAALIPENIKLVYLKRSLVLEMIKKPESIETKIIGSFVRVKLDPRDSKQLNSHQLVQITGINHGSSDKCCCESLIHLSNMAGDVCLNMLSDDEFSNEECDEFRKKVKSRLLKKLTVVELEQKAKVLHEDITNHRIARELELALQNIPRVIPEEVELESLDGNDNQMDQCSDGTTLQTKIILE